MKIKILQTLLEKTGEGAPAAVMVFGAIEAGTGLARKFDFITRADSKTLGGLAFLATGFLLYRGQRRSKQNAKAIAGVRDDAVAAAQETAAQVVRETMPGGVPVYREGP